MAGERYDRVCYATRGHALRAFVGANRHVIEPWGGVHKRAAGGEFDAVNERYELRGKRRAITIGQAVDAVLPRGRPYCLDRVDLDTLNETTPGRDAGPFVLPDLVAEHKAYESYMRGLGQHEDYLREQAAHGVTVPFEDTAVDLGEVPF